MRKAIGTALLLAPLFSTLFADGAALAKKNPKPVVVAVQPAAAVVPPAPPPKVVATLPPPAPVRSGVVMQSPAPVVVAQPVPVHHGVQVGATTATVSVQAGVAPVYGGGVQVQVGHPVPPTHVVVVQQGDPALIEEQPVAYGSAYPAPPPPPGPGCAMMHGSRVSELAAAIQGESFSSGQLRVLGDFAQGSCFLVAHVERILPLFSFEEDKLKALQLMAPTLVDRQNAFRIYKLFTFDASKDQARQILAR